MFIRILSFFIIVTLTISCGSKPEIEDEIDENTTDCKNTDVTITAQDNIVINHATNPVVWKGYFTETSLKVFFTRAAGNDNETETFNFVFLKQNNCLQKDRAYKYYDGKKVDISAVTEMDVLEFYTSKWEKDKHFSGLIVYRDPHDKKIYSKKIWVDPIEKPAEINNPDNYIFFENCFDDKLPIDIDMNNDNIVDYKLTYEKIEDIGNKPNYDRYTFKLISTNQSENEILSPKKSESPYFVIFEPPFNSENTRQYFNGVKNQLDVFYEFKSPYEEYNFFLNNNLTNAAILNNNKKDYFLIRMSIGNEKFYGWIQFKFNATNCEAAIIETYLSPNNNEHIYVKTN